MSTLTDTQALQVLDALYADGVDKDADWSAVDSDISAHRDGAESGDSALQSLMTFLVADKVQGTEQVQRVEAALAGIKQFMIHEILEELPTTSIEDLKAAADKAGYDLEIIA